MIIVYSRNKIPIRLTEERWGHITRRHPEMEEQRDKVLETIADPGMIQEGDFGEVLAVRFYSTTPLTQKYLVVAYKEEDKQDGFVLTAYFTSAVSKRRTTVWTR